MKWLLISSLIASACGSDVGAVADGVCAVKISGNRPSALVPTAHEAAHGADSASVFCLYEATNLLSISVPENFEELSLPMDVTDEDIGQEDGLFFEWYPRGLAPGYLCVGGKGYSKTRGRFSYRISSAELVSNRWVVHGWAHLECPNGYAGTHYDQMRDDVLFGNVTF